MMAINLLDMKKANGIILFYSLAVLASRLRAGVMRGGDTQQYIDKSVIRPPLYPLLIDACNYIFAPYGYIVLVFLQLVFVLSAAFYLSHLLQKRFDLHPITFMVLHFFLSIPLLSCSVAVGIHGEIGNRILTEATSYGIFLFALSFVVKLIFSKKKRYVILFLLCVSLLTLIRTQMIILYPIALAMIPLFYKDNNYRVILGLVAIVFTVFLFTDLSERFYHKIVNDHFGKVSLNASHMLVGAVYVSDQQVLRLIENAEDREVLKMAYDSLENQKLLAKQRFEIDRRMVDLYNDNFATILKGITSSFHHVHGLPVWEDSMLVKLEEFSRRVVPVLMLNYFKDISKLMLLKFLYTLNFREGFFFGSFLLFAFVRFKTELKLFAFFVLLMLLLNRAAMTPIIYLGDRYLFYTDILEYAVLIVMSEQYLKNLSLLSCRSRSSLEGRRD